MERPYQIVDAFTTDRFDGNPAAVVLDSRDLTAAQMQSIAAEFNLSETTFVLPPTTPEATVRVRWFSPTTEVAMCGHATIAAIHALVESGRLGLDPEHQGLELSIETQSGTLAAAVEALPGQEASSAVPRRVYWLQLPTPQLRSANLPVDKLVEALGLAMDDLADKPPMVLTQDDDVILFVRATSVVHGARPDFAGLARFQQQFRLRGVCLTTLHTLTPSVNTESRFFAPATGIDEDPVTGSVHGPLAAHLLANGLVETHDGIAGLQCVQTKAGSRSGLVWVLVGKDQENGYEVKIGGHAITSMKGTLL